MNIKKILAAAAASAVAVSALAVSAIAYDLDKDLGIGWSASITIPAEEFEGADENSVFTITYTVNEGVDDYWCIKTMVNDTGWPFVSSFIGPELSEGKDTYVTPTDKTEIKFMMDADTVERFQEAGMAIMGHGITLGTFSWSNDDTLPTASAPVSGDVAAATDSSKGSPDTGVADVAAVAGIAVVAGGALLISRKRK